MTQNLLYFGLGAINLTREKARDLVNDLVARGEVEKNEASALVENLMEKGRAERDELKKMLREEVNNLAQGLNMVDDTRITALEERIRALEAKTGE
jgi:polyhydroxyalkanoate synthesis regulator phasin